MTPGEWQKKHFDRMENDKYIRGWKDMVRDGQWFMLESRRRTAARLWAMRKALIWYADHMPNKYENNYAELDIELRRQAVQEVRDA